MAIVRYTGGKEPASEERAAMQAELDAAARLPYTHDPDCPLLTEEQLAEFRPARFKNMEERARAMESAKAHIERA